MGITTKGRRKITVDGQLYVWFVDSDADYRNIMSVMMVVNVISFDKKFSAAYQLNQVDDQRFVVVKGKEFEGADTGKCWKRYLCPKLESSYVVTPKVVRALIQWCLKPHQVLVEVDWQGREIENPRK